MSWLSVAWDWYAAQSGKVNPMVAGVGGAALVWAAIRQAQTATWTTMSNSRRNEEQTRAEQQRRVTESFSKATEQLASEKMEARLGGIYTLERLAQEAIASRRAVSRPHGWMTCKRNRTETLSRNPIEIRSFHKRSFAHGCGTSRTSSDFLLQNPLSKRLRKATALRNGRCSLCVPEEAQPSVRFWTNCPVTPPTARRLLSQPLRGECRTASTAAGLLPPATGTNSPALAAHQPGRCLARFCAHPAHHRAAARDKAPATAAHRHAGAGPGFAGAPSGLNAADLTEVPDGLRVCQSRNRPGRAGVTGFL